MRSKQGLFFLREKYIVSYDNILIIKFKEDEYMLVEYFEMWSNNTGLMTALTLDVLSGWVMFGIMAFIIVRSLIKEGVITINKKSNKQSTIE